MDLAKHQAAPFAAYAVITNAKQLRVAKTTAMLGIRVVSVEKVETKVLDMVLVERSLLKSLQNDVVCGFTAFDVDHGRAAAVVDDPDQGLVGRQGTTVRGEVVDAGARSNVASSRSTEAWRRFSWCETLRRLGEVRSAVALLHGHGHARSVFLVDQGRRRTRADLGEILTFNATGETLVSEGGRRSDGS